MYGVWNMPSLLLLQGQLWWGMVLLFRVSYMGQIDLFKSYLYSIRSCTKKKKKKLMKNRYKNVNMNVYHYHHWGMSRASTLLTLSTSIPIDHCSDWILWIVSSVRTVQMYVSFGWSVNTSVSIFRSPLEKLAYDFVLTSSEVPKMSCSSLTVCKMGGK